jgi:hypothetical protein
MLVVTILNQDDGLTFREVIQNIPHDGPAIVVYVLLLIFAALVWMGSRPSASQQESPHTDATRTERGENGSKTP